MASLRKVLEGIPISLASFFTDETEMDSEVIFRADDMPDLGTPIPSATAWWAAAAPTAPSA